MSKEVSIRLGNINYACTISDGHHEWMMDEPADNGGNDIAHDPFAALLASIGSCSAITMKMYAQRKDWPVEEIEIKMSVAIQTEAGKRKAVFKRDMFVKGNLNREQLIRLEQIAAVCPISKILEGDIIVETGLTHITNEYSANLNDVRGNT